MDFTIVTPSYNYGRFIADCLRSIAQQEGVTFEHLVMDAGSTDDTGAVVAGFPHAQFFQEPDKGMSDGINKGFLKAQGQWVMWLNADDQLKPGALRTIKEWSDKHPDADVIYGGWDFTDVNGVVTKRMVAMPFDLQMLVHMGCYIGSTACFYRKASVIDQGYLLNVHFKVVMDGEYYARLGRSGKRFSACPESIAQFRIHGQNLSFKNSHGRDVDEHLRYQYQIAESVAIRRAYGWTLFHHAVADMIPDALLWYYYRGKKLLKNLLIGSQAPHGRIIG